LTVAPIFTALTGYVYANGSSAATASTSIPISALTYDYTTVNGTTCTLGSGCTITATAPISNIQITTATSSISAYSSSSAVAVTMTGVTTACTFTITPATDISGVNGYGPIANETSLYFIAWPTSNTFNYRLNNPTNAAITPGAVTWNVSAQCN
jgi:hypothetical protein